MAEHLDEFDFDEWFDVARAINPKMTREQFKADMAEFSRLKAEHQRRKEMQ